MLAYLLSYPAALRAVQYPGSRFDRSSLDCDICLSLPVFWVGGMLLLLLANPSIVQIFRSPVFRLPADGRHPFFLISRLYGTIPYLILPTVSHCYGSWAFSHRSILRDTFLRNAVRLFQDRACKRTRSEKPLNVQYAFRATPGSRPSCTF